MGEEGEEEGMGLVTSETNLIQYPEGAISLPEFDLMKFSAEWTNTTTNDMTGVEGWTKIGEGNNAYWKYKDGGDLDVYTYTSQTNIPITSTKTLDKYGVGYAGNKNMCQVSIDRNSIITVRKNCTKIFTSTGEEVTKDSIEEYNLSQNPPLPADSGKDVYDLFQYLAWSGDNRGSGGEYTVLNFGKIINNVAKKEKQKAVFIYMKFIWALSYNGTGNFNLKYNIYKLNNEEKGLISPSGIFEFNPEDNSVKEQSVSSNILSLHKDNRTSQYYSSVELYGDPIATLYYDLSSKSITFLKGEYKEEDIYGPGDSSDTFQWDPINNGN